MDRKEKLERLRSYLKRIAPEGELEGLAPGSGDFESVRGVARDREIDAANRGIVKLAREQAPDEDEMRALEAIVAPTGRPVIDIVADSFETPPAPWSHLGEEAARAPIEAAIPSIGRIEVPEHPQVPYAGTGFVVGEGLIMTNRHVAALFASGVGARGLQFLPGQRAGLDFRREFVPSDPVYVEVKQVAMIHPHWDMALLRVEGLLESRGSLTLAVDHPEDLQGREVAVIGYPAQDWRSDVDLQNRIFRGVFNVKRLQPGKVMGRSEIRSFGHYVTAVTHDSSTLGGNSGSAVVDLESGQVVGLHFAGRYLEANFAVPTHELARDSRIVDAGVVFGGTLEATSAWDPAWATADPPDEQEQSSLPAAVVGSEPRSPLAAGGDTGLGTWTIPLQISVRVGTPSRGPSRDALGLTLALEAPRYSVEPDPRYDLRRGYDSRFLGGDHEIPYPWLTDEQYRKVARNRWASEKRHVLPYSHFSVVMNRERRLAYYSAVNIDGRSERSISREDFNDKWFLDPRILPGEQLQDDLYVRNKLDRGHLVRRLDPVWGEQFSDAKTAHDDTFHWTNCSPQHERFNRSKSTWGGVENYILHNTNTRDLRVTVFTGPVFGDDDPMFTTEGGDQVKIPLQFWKVVAVVRPDGQLSATAYLLSQSRLVDDMLAEEFVFGPFKEFQTTVREIEELTELSFHQLRQHDPLGTGVEEATSRPRVVLGSFANLVL